jgi:hypothetical protein
VEQRPAACRPTIERTRCCIQPAYNYLPPKLVYKPLHLHYCIIGRQHLSTVVEVFLSLLDIVGVITGCPLCRSFRSVCLFASLCECLGASWSPVLPQHSHDKKHFPEVRSISLICTKFQVGCEASDLSDALTRVETRCDVSILRNNACAWNSWTSRGQSSPDSCSPVHRHMAMQSSSSLSLVQNYKAQLTLCYLTDRHSSSFLFEPHFLLYADPPSLRHKAVGSLF